LAIRVKDDRMMNICYDRQLIISVFVMKMKKVFRKDFFEY
jgi:hypothetical protein